MLCVSNPKSFEEVCNVPLPAHTDSWRPVPYRNAIEFVRETARHGLGLDIAAEAYGLSKTGDQLFGLIALGEPDESGESRMSIGIRQSYNKSLALGVAVGAQVMVCENLMFSGSAFKVLRKNTTNVWADFKSLVIHQVTQSQGVYRETQQTIIAMKEIRVSTRRGFETLGRMLGEKVITPTQANVAFRDWREPRHPDFAPRNAWSLYNCVTEGLKKGRAGRVLDSHAAAHDFFVQEVA